MITLHVQTHCKYTPAETMNFSLLSIFAVIISFVCASNFNCNCNEISAKSNQELSWFQGLLIGFFSPDGLKILEKISCAEDRPVTIQLSDLDFESKRPYRQAVNNIPMEALDFEDDEEFNEYVDHNFEDKLIVKVHSASFGVDSTYELTFNLYSELFSSAISEMNSQRLVELLTSGLGYKLSREDVFKIFSLAIEATIEYPFNEETYEIVEMLFAANFADKLDRRVPEDSSANWNNLFMNIFQNLRAAQIFIRSDPTFFSRKTNSNYIALEISRFNFTAALNALNCGIDPSILLNGRNALDAILAAIECGLASDSDRSSFITISNSSREQLLERLVLHQPKLKETMSFDNFALACNENRPDLAKTILRSGRIVPTEFYLPGNKVASPLSKALHLNDCNIIVMACELYCDSLTLDQALHARSELLHNIKKQDISPFDFLHEIYFRIDARIKSF